MISLKNIPFTYHWIVRKAMGTSIKTVLDLGCGTGDFIKNLARGEDWLITGVELHAPSVEKANNAGIYKKVIKGDVVNLPKSILNKRFDVVFASQVLEHLKKSDGKRALKCWQKITKRKLVVTTPVGFIEYDPIENKEKNNPLQKHLSGWVPSELSKQGFKVRGQGARFVYGKNGLARILPSIMPFWSVLALFFSPLTYIFPDKGLYMIAEKEA